MRITKGTRDPQAKGTGGLRQAYRNPGKRKAGKDGSGPSWWTAPVKELCNCCTRRSMFRALPGPLSEALVSGKLAAQYTKTANPQTSPV